MHRLRAFGLLLLAPAVYMVTAVTITWEAWKGTVALVSGGDHADWTGTLWTYWWTAKALSEGMNPVVGSWNFYPLGISPVAQYNLLDAVLAAPFLWLLGPIRGFNVFAVVLLASSALAMDRLARGAGASRAGALVAGLGLELSTFVGLETYEGRFSQILLAPMLLGLLSLFRLSRGEGGVGRAVLTGLLVSATLLGYWYYGLFLVLGAIPLWLAEVRRWDRRRLGLLALAAAITALLCGPVVIALIRSFDALPGMARPMDTSLFDYGDYGRGSFGLSMAINQSLWPGWPLSTSGSPTDDHRIALVLLLLGLGGLPWGPRGRLRWAALLALGYVLALGPYVRDQAGAPHPWKLPYLFLYDHTPLLDRLWWPERFSILAWIGLCVLAALHLDRFVEALRRRGRLLGHVAVAAAALALGWDALYRNSFLPVAAEPGRPVTLPVYRNLSGPIVTVPVLGQDPSSRHLLWFQIFHGQPILSGLGAHLAGHRPAGYEDYIYNNGLLRALAAVSEGTGGGQTVLPEDIDALRRDGFVWAVLDPMALTGTSRTELSRIFNEIFTRLWGPPDIPKGHTAAWRVSPINAPVTMPDHPRRAFTYTRESEKKPDPSELGPPTKPPEGPARPRRGARPPGKDRQ